MNYLLWLFLIVTRLRDRLRCPECGAVGTYKLHAPGNGRPWRWLCKWCGFYRGPEGTGKLCCPSPTFRCWIFKSQPEGFKGKTPEEMIFRECVIQSVVAGENPTPYKVWPWRG